MKKPLILVGGGGHCKSVIDVAESAGYTILGILDKPEEVGKSILDYKVIGSDDDMDKYASEAEFMVTVGQIQSPKLRMKLHTKLDEAGCKLATIIAPTAHVSKYAKLGGGTIVMHNAIVNADASIGKGCIINTFANIEHDVQIGDYCHISTGAMINGGAYISEGTFVGSQSIVNQCVKIAGGGVIASGSVVNKDITGRGVYAGNPAKLIRQL